MNDFRLTAVARARSVGGRLWEKYEGRRAARSCARACGVNNFDRLCPIMFNPNVQPRYISFGSVLDTACRFRDVSRVIEAVRLQSPIKGGLDRRGVFTRVCEGVGCDGTFRRKRRGSADHNLLELLGLLGLSRLGIEARRTSADLGDLV